MIRYSEGTVYLIFGKHKIELWAQKLDLDKAHIWPSMEFYPKRDSDGFILCSTWIQFNIGFSYELMDEETLDYLRKTLEEAKND